MCELGDLINNTDNYYTAMKIKRFLAHCQKSYVSLKSMWIKKILHFIISNNDLNMQIYIVDSVVKLVHL